MVETLFKFPNSSPIMLKELGAVKLPARDKESKTFEELCFRGRRGCSMHNSSLKAQAAGGFPLNGGVLFAHPLPNPNPPTLNSKLGILNPNPRDASLRPIKA